MRGALGLLDPGVAPDRPALVDGAGARIDHATLRAAVDRARRDLPAGRKALVLVRPRPVAASVVAILAVLAAGHALMPWLWSLGTSVRCARRMQ